MDRVAPAPPVRCVPALRGRGGAAWLLAVALALAAPTSAQPAAAEGAGRPTPEGRGAQRPNVVVVMADDMGYSDLGVTGGEIETPHLDALAREGLLFERFYNMGRCFPTRASLLTGLAPHQAGVGGGVKSVGVPDQPGPYQGYLNDRSVTIAEALAPAGYRSYLSGKWHVGEDRGRWPLDRGFDAYFGLISGASSYWEIITEQPRVRQMAYMGEPWTPPATGFYMTDAIADTAAAFVERHAAEHAGAPFFLYVAFTAPHWPLHAPEATVQRYAGRYDAGWDAVRDARLARLREAGLVPPGAAVPGRPAGVPTWDDVPAAERADWTRRMEVYAAMMDKMDQGVGRVLDALDRTGQRENTVVLFLSDNGAAAEDVSGRGLHDPSVPIGWLGSYDAYREPWAWVSATPFRRYKATAYEGGIATPLVVSWPAGLAAPGRRTGSAGSVVDLLPTVLDLAGAPYPGTHGGRPIMPAAGVSLAPVFADPEWERGGPLFSETFGARAVRDGRWKAVYDTADERWRLFDLATDPFETADVLPAHGARAVDMVDRWYRWADGVGVLPDLREGQPIPGPPAAPADL